MTAVPSTTRRRAPVALGGGDEPAVRQQRRHAVDDVQPHVVVVAVPQPRRAGRGVDVEHVGVALVAGHDVQQGTGAGPVHGDEVGAGSCGPRSPRGPVSRRPGRGAR